MYLFYRNFKRLLKMATSESFQATISHSKRSSSLSSTSSSNNEQEEKEEEEESMTHYMSQFHQTTSHEETTSLTTTESQAKVLLSADDRRVIREEIKNKLSQELYAGTPFTQLSKKSQKKLINLRLAHHLKKLTKNTTPNKIETIPRPQNLEQNIDDTLSSGRPTKLDFKRERDKKMAAAREKGQKLAIDCSMDDSMTPKQISSLARQIRSIYTSNVRSTNPFHLYLTSLDNGGKLHHACSQAFTGFDRVIPDITHVSFHEYFDKDKCVYLTPDSPNELLSLNPTKVYIMGGLVDSGGHWGHTYSNALKMGINTAKLPIDRYMEKTESLKGQSSHCDKHRDVALAINQVFDMLLDVKDGKNWEETLVTHLPRRKNFKLKTKET